MLSIIPEQSLYQFIKHLSETSNLHNLQSTLLYYINYTLYPDYDSQCNTYFPYTTTHEYAKIVLLFIYRVKGVL